jgi:hypothetical protein
MSLPPALRPMSEPQSRPTPVPYALGRWLGWDLGRLRRNRRGGIISTLIVLAVIVLFLAWLYYEIFFPNVDFVTVVRHWFGM